MLRRPTTAAWPYACEVVPIDILQFFCKFFLEIKATLTSREQQMLIEFKVANCLSFKEETTLSMVASSDKARPENIIADVPGFKGRLLKSAVIYGANASGKSNLVKAMGLMRRLVLHSAIGSQRNDPLPVPPFRLDPENLVQPATFQVSCIIDDAVFVYGFSATQERVVEEWLYSYPRGPRRVLFERTTSDEGKTTLKFGAAWKGERKSLEANTRGNALFLSVATQFNHELAGRVYDWFKIRFMAVTDSGKFYKAPAMGFSATKVIEEPAFKASMLRLLQMADLGIVDLLAERQEIGEAKFLDKLPEKLKNALISLQPEEAYIHKVKTVHKMRATDGAVQLVEFDLEDEESSGTRSLFAIAGPFVDTLQSGIALVMDEFDSDWHSLLTCHLVGMFHDPEINAANAQFIFTTHDDSLLDADLFRRDQVWFVEKDATGASELFSLGDFTNVRKKGINIRKRYRSGIYGGVPILSRTLLKQMMTNEE